MKINPYMFRGYDLRGRVGQDLTPETVEAVGKAYGTFLKRQGIKSALVSRDSRATSPAFSQIIVKSLSWAGLDVIDIGMNLIGTFYWSQYYLDCKGGVFVTASHNPADYNGFKFANGFSETLVAEGMNELKRMVENDDYEKGEKPGRIKRKDIRKAYLKDLLKRLPVNKKFKVVVDAGFSTAGEIVPKLLKKAGCKVIESNCKLDPSFPLGAPDPTEVNFAMRLRSRVLKEKADVGFSYDSDGDRIGIVDSSGSIVWNDVLLSLFAIDVLREHPGATIMYNTLCSRAVEETVVKYGGKPFMWRTGHSFLKKKNQEVKADFIGELSGHFFFSSDFYNHDDGLYSTLRLLNYLAETGQTLYKAIDLIPKYVSSPEIKIYCADEKKVDLIKKISLVLKNDFPEAKVIDDERAGDGVRMDFPDSMFVIRYSQNAPYLTIKFEAKKEEKYNELKKYIKDLLSSYEEIDWNSNMNVNLESFS